MPLKYLFQVTYKDGSTYTQNEEDRSETEPETRSCFFDVKQDEIKSFFMFNNEHQYSVNLEDGHFEVDGLPFFMHSDFLLKDFRIVFYRLREYDIEVSVEKDKVLAHRVAYCFGWQTNDKDGKNVQRVMTIQ